MRRQPIADGGGGAGVGEGGGVAERKQEGDGRGRGGRYSKLAFCMEMRRWDPLEAC